MCRDSQSRAAESLPTRPPDYQAAEAAGLLLVNNEAMSSTLRLWRANDEYGELLKRTRDGLIALGTNADYEPTRVNGEHLQREVDGVIGRWKADHPGVQRAC